MGDARTGAKTDVMHNVWMVGTDDAWTGAMTDMMHELQTGCAYNALTIGDFTRFLCR